jgi:predicted CXXCH cytochrome family protein
MKKHILFIVSILAVIACFAAVASAGIVGSQHDLTAWSGYGNFRGDNDEVCIYCHTPHSAISADRNGTRLPLWNRTLSEGQNFTLYSNPGSLQAVMPGDGKPTGYSLLCLSCHDGVTSLGAVINNSQGFVGDIPVTPTNFSLALPAYQNLNIGRDLSNDHPVSFVYDNTLVTNDQTANGGVIGLASPATISPLKLAPGSRLECTTCHEPHNNTNAPFLRMSNTGSAMCRKCHLK